MIHKVSYHMSRVTSLIQGAVAQIIAREIKDPAIGMITVTNVEVSKDQAIAKVYVLVHDESQKNRALKKLKILAKTIRHQLAEKVQLRKTPELHFFYDDVASQGIRISQLLDSR